MRFVEQPRLAMGARAGAEIQQRSRGADFWVSVRFASTAKEASPLDANLLRVLKTEIQHESEEYEPPPVLHTSSNWALFLIVSLRMADGLQQILGGELMWTGSLIVLI